MFKRLLPRETNFFDFFDQHAALTVTGAKEFQRLVSGDVNIGPQAKRIKELEHETDVITHRCIEALHRTFITPIERNDIHRLISRMDDIMDFVDAAAERISLYEISEMTSDAKALADVLVRAAQEVEHAVHGLRDMKNAQLIREKCIAINRLENEADSILRSALATLFRTEKDPIVVIKWKEIYEMLETATDRCEDVANIIDGVTLENA